jgi:hypothetical protein
MIENYVSALFEKTFSSQLVPSLVGPLLEVSLVPQREVRQTLLPLLFRLMETEQAHKGNFRSPQDSYWVFFVFLFRQFSNTDRLFSQKIILVW